MDGMGKWALGMYAMFDLPINNNEIEIENETHEGTKKRKKKEKKSRVIPNIPATQWGQAIKRKRNKRAENANSYKVEEKKEKRNKTHSNEQRIEWKRNETSP